VRVNYNLSPATLRLLARMDSGQSMVGITAQTVKVALREQLVTRTSFGLERTALGRLVTRKDAR
jgi:hypothetical protein